MSSTNTSSKYNSMSTQREGKAIWNVIRNHEYLSYDELNIKLDKNFAMLEYCIHKIKDLDKKLETVDGDDDVDLIRKKKENFIRERDNNGTHRIRLHHAIARLERLQVREQRMRTSREDKWTEKEDQAKADSHGTEEQEER
ncbi:hypothetical protein MMC24_006257 [Lignoscripta atroalba]|nr:hypothetical protein [Lignoscripta atroalba]